LTSTPLLEQVAVEEILPYGVLDLRQGAAARRVIEYLAEGIGLVGVLVWVSILAVRLMRSNTAFLDEATYLSAGHVVWHNFIHGGSNLHYATYFSGAPVVYPVLAAAASALGGLFAARCLSLAFILITIVALHQVTRYIFGRRAAFFACAAFATIEGVEFLGAFATYDAMALMLIAVATWVVVSALYHPKSLHTAVGTLPLGHRWSLPLGRLLLGAPVLVLANAAKYASALFDPVVVGAVLLVSAALYGWKTGLRAAAVFASVLVVLLSAATAFAGPSYLAGIKSTTLLRKPGTTTASAVLLSSWHWIGVITLLGFAAVALWIVTDRRRELSPGWIRPSSDPVGGRAGLLPALVLFAVAPLLAPSNQARIMTSVSLSKHVTFGAWFGCIAVGYLLAKVGGHGWSSSVRWPLVGVMLALMSIAGTHQDEHLYHEWPNSTELDAMLKPVIASTGGGILIDDSEVEEYYLGADTDPARWNNTYYLSYTPPGARRALTGPAAFGAAVANNYFGVVALDFGAQKAVDHAVERAIAANKHYRYVGKVPAKDVFGTVSFVIWRDDLRGR
jgi:hypothetical protein